MIQSDVINGIATGVVGWKQPTRSGSPVLAAANTGSSSGLYFQHGNGLCTIDNIHSAVDDELITDANFNTYLEDLTKAAFNDLLIRVFDGEDFIDGGLLFKYENKFSETLENATDFVGFEIDLHKRNNISVVMNSLLLEFDSTNTVKVLLFNSQRNTLIDSQEVTTVANTQTSAVVRWVLNDLQYGGKWYVGYLRSGLTAKAIKRNYDQASIQTPFCGAEIRSIRVPSWNAETMFNPSDIVYESDTWGLNFNLSVHEDYTEIVRSNPNRFAKALQLQVCANVLDLLSNTVNSNRNERLSKAYALMELNGNRFNQAFPEHAGVLSKLNSEIKRLRQTYRPTGIKTFTL